MGIAGVPEILWMAGWGAWDIQTIDTTKILAKSDIMILSTRQLYIGLTKSLDLSKTESLISINMFFFRLFEMQSERVN